MHINEFSLQLFAFVAFAVSVIWIDFIANEIMAVLFTFGVVFQLSDAILGLTILAWGNSVGGIYFNFLRINVFLDKNYSFNNLDFAADISMARQNAPRMGFSACYGAPLLSKAGNVLGFETHLFVKTFLVFFSYLFTDTLLGLGISFLIVCTQLGESVPVSFDYLNLIMTVSLGASLVTVLVYLPLARFQADKWLGIVLFAVYLFFVTAAVLQEAGVLWPDL